MYGQVSKKGGVKQVEEVRYMISDAANLLHMESHVLRYWEEELDLKIPRNEMGHRYYTKENLQQFEQIRKLKEQGYQLKAIKMLIHNQNPQIRKEERLNTQGVGQTGYDEAVSDGRNSSVIADVNSWRAEAKIDPHGSEGQQKNEWKPEDLQNFQKGDYREVREEFPENHTCVAAGTIDGQALGTDGTQNHMMEHHEMNVSESQIPEEMTPLEQFQNMMSRIVKDAIAENNQELGREVGEQVGERVLKEMNYLMREQEEQEEERFRKLDEAIRSRQKNSKRKEEKANRKELKKSRREFRKKKKQKVRLQPGKV